MIQDNIRSSEQKQIINEKENIKKIEFTKDNDNIKIQPNQDKYKIYYK